MPISAFLDVQMPRAQPHHDVNVGYWQFLPAIIVYNYREGGQSKPTDFFDTVKFQGNLVADGGLGFGKVDWPVKRLIKLVARSRSGIESASETA